MEKPSHAQKSLLVRLGCEYSLSQEALQGSEKTSIRILEKLGYTYRDQVGSYRLSSVGREYLDKNGKRR